MDDPRIPRVICTVTLHSKSEQNQVQTSGFGTPNLGPLSLSYCAQERSCDREMSILGNAANAYLVITFARDGSKDAPYTIPFHPHSHPFTHFTDGKLKHEET